MAKESEIEKLLIEKLNDLKFGYCPPRTSIYRRKYRGNPACFS